MNASLWDLDETDYMSVLTKGNKWLKKLIKSGLKLVRLLKNRFDSELAYNDKWLKTKIKIYEGKIKTNLILILFVYQLY